jgi:hypothetical protein
MVSKIPQTARYAPGHHLGVKNLNFVIVPPQFIVVKRVVNNESGSFVGRHSRSSCSPGPYLSYWNTAVWVLQTEENGPLATTPVLLAWFPDGVKIGGEKERPLQASRREPSVYRNLEDEISPRAHNVSGNLQNYRSAKQTDR